MNDAVLHRCPLFQGLEGDALQYALAFFEAKEKSYRKGELLNRIGAPLSSFALVLDGIVQVYMDDIEGNHMIMANVGPGETFGESLCFLGCDTHVYICSETDCTVLQMKTNRIHNMAGSTSPTDTDLTVRFASMLAERTLRMNDRIQILSKSTTREKLLTLFSQYLYKNGTREFKLPFNRDSMAVYLGVNRSALSRELGAMQREGIISFRKNEFKLLENFIEL